MRRHRVDEVDDVLPGGAIIAVIPGASLLWDGDVKEVIEEPNGTTASGLALTKHVTGDDAVHRLTFRDDVVVGVDGCPGRELLVNLVCILQDGLRVHHPHLRFDVFVDVVQISAHRRALDFLTVS